jgi:predicted amidohydrolase
MRVTVAQIKPILSKRNIERHIEIIEQYREDSDLIVFPELSLNGYYLQDKAIEDSWSLDEFSEIEELSKSVDIIVGGAVKERRRLYNSSLYFSGGELQSQHRKIELPNYGLFEEARFFSGGDEVQSFETDFGRTVQLVCEDLWSGNAISELSKLEPDLITVISNSPARNFRDDGTILIAEQWKALLRTSSILSGSYTLFVNRVGFEDGLGFWGGSTLISPKGETVFEMPLFEERIETFNIEEL